MDIKEYAIINELKKCSEIWKTVLRHLYKSNNEPTTIYKFRKLCKEQLGVNVKHSRMKHILNTLKEWGIVDSFYIEVKNKLVWYLTDYGIEFCKKYEKELGL